MLRGVSTRRAEIRSHCKRIPHSLYRIHARARRCRRHATRGAFVFRSVSSSCADAVHGERHAVTLPPCFPHTTNALAFDPILAQYFASGACLTAAKDTLD